MQVLYVNLYSNKLYSTSPSLGIPSLVFTCKLTALTHPKRPQRNSTHLLPRGTNGPKGGGGRGIVMSYRVGVKGDNKTLADKVGINVASENTGAENEVFVQ